MTNRGSPIKCSYPIPVDFCTTARKWKPDAIDIMLGCIWSGYDRLLQKDGFVIRIDDVHLEDEITMALYARIQDVQDPFSPFVVVHQWPEVEKQKDKGRPPQCDLGFRPRDGNLRSHFTIEAKNILTEGAVAPYVSEINDNFLTGRYSTFSSEAAMLGYLLSGNPQKTFDAISANLGVTLQIHTSFAHRHQRFSDHQRKNGNDVDLAIVQNSMRCHHLLLSFAPVTYEGDSRLNMRA
ncbi:MAG: hypothetical protein NTX50_03325 [Candidatus Sumerlaeota bacterium]|nr:hypothetical protein [Candidatus Sumerlaeota bacterium]